MATPITVASVVTNPGGTGSTIVPVLPSHQADDVIEIFVGKTGNVAWSAPAGWTIKHQSTVGTSSNGTVGTLLYRRVLSTDSLPLPNPTCNLGATVTRGAIAITKRGADTESVYNSASWGATSTTTGTANPIRPFSVVTPAPEMLVHHYYCQRAATNAPEPTGYTEDQQIIISGTLVLNVSEKNVADQQTTLNNQDASPTSGARWVGMISCTPSSDYPYYRSGSQATTASGTSVTPTKPTGTTDNDTRGNADVMIITVEGSGSTTLAMADTGLWNEVGGAWSGTTGGGGSSVKKFWCYATPTPNMQATRTGTGEISACVTTYYNCNQSNPIGVFDADARASSSAPTFDAITRGSTKSVVTATVVADGTPTFAFPGGWTERMDGLGIGCGDQTYNAVGDSASGSIGLSAASPTLIGLLELIGIASASLTTLTPANASLALSSFAPKLVIAITPATAALTLTALTPSALISGALIDDFNDNSRDTSKWSLGSIAFQNATVGVAETNQRVEITPLANEASPAIYGYWSANAYDFTGRQARVRIATSIGTDTEAWLVVALDTANYLRTWVAGGTLQTRSRENNTNSNQSHGSFDFATQSHWRIRHDNATNEIVWEVGTGDNWTELRRLATPFSITAITVYLSGGTGGSVASPAIVTFDDFALNVLTQVIPASTSLALTGFAPRLVGTLTPLASSLSLTTFAPSVTVGGGETVVTPATATLTTTATAPSLQLSVVPASATLTITTAAAQLRQSLTPASMSITATTFAPIVTTVVTVPPVLLSLTTFAATVAANVTVTPAATTLVISSFTVALQEVVIPVTQSVTLTTNAPSLTIATTPITTTLSLGVFAPSLNETTTPSTAALSLTTFAPAVTVSADITVEPLSAALVVSGFTPILREQVTPNTATISLSTFAPLVTVSGSEVIPTTANLIISSFVPSLKLFLAPDIAPLSLTTFAPTVSTELAVVPASQAITVTVFAPGLYLRITPSTRTLTLLGFMPSVTTAGEDFHPRNMFTIGRESRILRVSREGRIA